MTFEIELGGRTRRISIERDGGGGLHRVAVDGRPLALQMRRAGDYGLILMVGTSPQKVPAALADKSQENQKLLASAGSVPVKVPGTGNGEPEGPVAYEVFVTPGRAPGEVLVTLGGRTGVATVNGRRSGKGADAGRQAPGEQSVVAPMPGRVVRVLVSPGDEVSPSQGVVVVEAMKMENELRAPRGGRVKDVSVSPGTSVEAGRVLVVIE
jgi:biotin carboxyl carrier protein